MSAGTVTGACTVLVVDPSPDAQARIAEHVEGRGFTVIAASNPNAALATMEFTAPDIVVTDLFLPTGAGLDLAKSLQQRPVRCPVIVMAEGDSAPAAIQALRAGAVDYLHKPVGVEELAHALERARLRLPASMIEVPGVESSEYRLTVRSNPAYVPKIVSWLIRTTAAGLPQLRQLQLRCTLQELLLNAMEHGNLEIYYHDKRDALLGDRYEALLAERLSHPRLGLRTVTVHARYGVGGREVEYRIADQGRGFKWRSMLTRGDETCPPEDTNGRGLFLARSFFPDLTYNDAGTEVRFTVQLS